MRDHLATGVVRGLGLALLAVLAVGLGACGGSFRAGAPGSSHGPARVAEVTQVDERAEDLTVESPSVGTVQVRVLRPPKASAAPPDGWPVLYLFHGCCDTYRAWSQATDIATMSSSLGLLVVMPDGGRAGFYSDWRDGPAWETFHTAELPALLATRYGAGRRAVVAGYSMGGLGALAYAARHPGRFAAAVSVSGVVHSRLTPRESQLWIGLIRSQSEDPDRLWGDDPVRDAATWAQHNPYDLAPQLRGVRVFVSAGNGKPGPLDDGRSDVDPLEASIGAENDALAQRLRSARVDATLDLYGAGTHTWAYCRRELHRAWPLITSALGLTGPAPSSGSPSVTRTGSPSDPVGPRT